MIPTREQLIEMLDAMSTRHPICRHPYLDQLCDISHNDPASLNRFIEALYVASATLRSCQLEIASRADHEEIKAALIADLHDEYGAGQLHNGRPFAMQKLLYSLGYTEFTPVGLHDDAQAVIKRIVGFCRKEPPLKALGCAWLGVRRGRLLLFQKISSAFRQKPVLRAVDLSAFEVRPGELERANEALAVVTPFMASSEGRRLLYEGLVASTTLFEELWSSMLRGRELPGLVESAGERNLTRPLA